MGDQAETEPRTEAERAKLEETVRSWELADQIAHVISGVLVQANVDTSREAAMALVLLAAEDVVQYDAASEEQFVEVARAAYQLRRFARRGEVS